MANDNTKTRLDANQVIKRVYDEDTESLRTLTTAVIGDITVEVTLDSNEDSVTIGNPNNGNTLDVKADGSIDVNLTNTGDPLPVEAVDFDIRNLDFVTDKVDVSGSTVSLDSTTINDLKVVTIENAAGVGAVNIQDGGNSITVDAVDFDIRNLDHTTDSIKVGDGTNFLVPNPDGSLNVVGDVTISGPVNVLIDEPLVTVPQGTDNGQPSGVIYNWVYNKRLQILDSHDRVANFIYADFGTKNQRIVRVDYTSSTFPGITIQRVFTYSLVSNRYRRDTETWSEI